MPSLVGSEMCIRDRLKPSYSLAIGKWFTPWVGARINYSGLQFKDGTLAVQEYHHLHADLLWNVLGGSYSRQEQVRWHLAPFAGIGLLHHATNGHNPFAVSYGCLLYTSDAADDLLCGDLCGCRII